MKAPKLQRAICEEKKACPMIEQDKEILEEIIGLINEELIWDYEEPIAEIGFITEKKLWIDEQKVKI